MRFHDRVTPVDDQIDFVAHSLHVVEALFESFGRPNQRLHVNIGNVGNAEDPFPGCRTGVRGCPLIGRKGGKARSHSSDYIPAIHASIGLRKVNVHA
ncbi:hypothetical protein GCM10028773_39490 [Spirosoma koreense]